MVNFLIEFANLIIKAIGTFISALMGLLPNSPFQSIDNTPVAEFLNNINWIIPVAQCLTILVSWGACIGIYYLIQIIMRWVKVIN